MGYWASTQSTQTQEFRQESGTRNQIQVSGQPDPSSWFNQERTLAQQRGAAMFVRSIGRAEGASCLFCPGSMLLLDSGAVARSTILH